VGLPRTLPVLFSVYAKGIVSFAGLPLVVSQDIRVDWGDAAFDRGNKIFKRELHQVPALIARGDFMSGAFLIYFRAGKGNEDVFCGHIIGARMLGSGRDKPRANVGISPLFEEGGVGHRDSHFCKPAREASTLSLLFGLRAADYPNVQMILDEA
jgi:hypothetical protein